MAKAMMSYCRGIKCDNPKCDYKDMSVEFKDYPEYVNKPCPKCGANLLTEHDYEVCKNVMALSDVLGKIEVPAEAVDMVMQIKLDGTGNVGYEVSKIK